MSNVNEKPLGQYHIFLQNSDGQLFPASVELGCRDWNDDRGRHTECRIKLKWDDGEIECIEGIFFVAFKRVREQLALRYLYPMCYGASRKIIITGMAADMALGLKVYKAEIGSFPSRSQLVHIFASGEDVEPVSVEEQEEFQRQWVESVRKK
ncbi:hypothetical protein H6G80_09565 [Nostoc sp. FACHB-87]|uniref:hypothetical protein n=1 Tax=Nostocaceae TaxID=1162 RepID=UPI00168599B6|nr:MULTISPECIES: hypothetical protein [Nostocaceae]MBD2454325.1 hypothetical protein [Nostoc sp. FACHB-87]MBD2474082.1 hypothetical protein [Anabaena sp. FACHB-83]